MRLTGECVLERGVYWRICTSDIFNSLVSNYLQFQSNSNSIMFGLIFI